jgi:hypothetical protein
VTDPLFPTSLRRNPDDPRSLRERIDAQRRERIEDAAEMAGLELMVELRKAAGRPAPDTASAADRAEFTARATEVLNALRTAFHAEIPPDARAAMEEAEKAGTDDRTQLLGGQAYLARSLPDYWQRFESHWQAYAQAQVAAQRRPAAWVRRFLG